MTTVEIPCGCDTTESLFDVRTRGVAGRKLLVLPATAGDGPIPGAPPAVWCATGHGWVTITPAQAETFNTVCASTVVATPGLSC